MKLTANEMPAALQIMADLQQFGGGSAGYVEYADHLLGGRHGKRNRAGLVRWIADKTGVKLTGYRAADIMFDAARELAATGVVELDVTG